MSEESLTGRRRLTSHAYLTFVAIDATGQRVAVPDLVFDNDDEKARAAEAAVRRDARLVAKAKLAELEADITSR